MKYENGSYTEIVEPVTIEDNELAQVDITNIEDRIVKMQFNIDIEIEEE